LAYRYKKVTSAVHRLIPSRFPPVSVFDWATSPEEAEQIAFLEGLTNDRLKTQHGDISLVAREDWVGGIGATPLMAAFTHVGESRFADGSYGVYYAGDSLDTAICETKFHRERFLAASNEPACLIQMREYIAHVRYELVDIDARHYSALLDPDPNRYAVSQDFAREVRTDKEWGLVYPSVRKPGATCVAIFRPPALTIPTQGCHLDYIWDGHAIVSVSKAEMIREYDKF
jgi:hypothetical protein